MKLSELTVEELRASHQAFIDKMRQVRLEHPVKMEHRGVPLVEIEHDPNWRENLLKRSPFDEA